MKSLRRMITPLVFGLLLTSPALGQVTYIYQGAPLVLITNSEHLSSAIANVTGQIVLSAPLAPNQANQVVTPLSFSFSAAADLSSSYVSPSGNANPVGGNFSFDTQNGVIVAWHIEVTGVTPWTSDTLSVDSSAGDEFYEDDFRGCGSAPCIYQSNTATPGTWNYGADLVAQLQAQVTSLQAQQTAAQAQIAALQKQLTHLTAVSTAYYNQLIKDQNELAAWIALAQKEEAELAACRAGKPPC